MSNISRRLLMQSSLTLGVTCLQESLTPGLLADSTNPDVNLLTNNTGVSLPPTARAYVKFSFDFPEPSVEFAGFHVSFRVYTYENTYAMDPERIRVERSGNSLVLRCSRLTWAGGQERRDGAVTGTLHKTAQGISVQASASVRGANMLSIGTVLRWIPRGDVSLAGGSFSSPGQNELSHSWPDLMGGMVSPLLVIRQTPAKFLSLALEAKPDTVRNSRFYLQPGDSGYRAELTYEREAWTEADSMETATWQVRSGDSYAAVAEPHYAHVAQAFDMPRWSGRTDVPAWFREVSLVVSLHGAHWTGYIMNDYARQLRILRWVAQQIDPRKVMVFLPAWDGRYYWNYPAYKTDPRMGGDAGFEKLIREGQRLGFHFVAMFGSNVANKDIPAFASVRDAVTIHPEGDTWNLDYVDWNNDRRNDANYGLMNLGVASWRNLLAGRISDVLTRFGIDGYFLDIVGTSENNRQGDMFLGTRQLVRDLQQKLPGRLCVGEMHYDALLGSIPVFQADATPEYIPAFYDYGRNFEHLSWPAPGRGSTGVHEFGFSPRGKLPTAQQRVIPTLTVVDDTFDKHRPEMQAVIAVAKQWKWQAR